MLGRLSKVPISGLKGGGVPEVDIDGRVRGTRRVRQYNL
jgi:hypothetical protein